MGPLHWEYGALATGPPGKSHKENFLKVTITPWSIGCMSDVIVNGRGITLTLG